MFNYSFFPAQLLNQLKFPQKNSSQVMIRKVSEGKTQPIELSPQNPFPQLSESIWNVIKSTMSECTNIG
jgi:hypothetical protein